MPRPFRGTLTGAAGAKEKTDLAKQTHRIVQRCTGTADQQAETEIKEELDQTSPVSGFYYAVQASLAVGFGKLTPSSPWGSYFTAFYVILGGQGASAGKLEGNLGHPGPPRTPKSLEIRFP